MNSATQNVTNKAARRLIEAGSERIEQVFEIGAHNHPSRLSWLREGKPGGRGWLGVGGLGSPGFVKRYPPRGSPVPANETKLVSYCCSVC